MLKNSQKYQSFKVSVSHTTRTPRSNEVDGVDYIIYKEFEKLVKQKNFMNMQKFLMTTGKESVT